MTPELFDVATNCLLIVYDVSLELLFESVNKVLTTVLGSLYITQYFFLVILILFL